MGEFIDYEQMAIDETELGVSNTIVYSYTAINCSTDKKCPAYLKAFLYTISPYGGY